MSEPLSGQIAFTAQLSGQIDYTSDLSGQLRSTLDIWALLTDEDIAYLTDEDGERLREEF